MNPLSVIGESDVSPQLFTLFTCETYTFPDAEIPSEDNAAGELSHCGVLLVQTRFRFHILERNIFTQMNFAVRVVGHLLLCV